MKIPAVAALALALAAPQAHALTPDEAYAAIPHQRTTFDASASKAAAAQVASLERLFALTDQGVVLRVEAMRLQRARDSAGVKRSLARYDALIASLEGLKLAAEVEPARELVANALRDQRRFLATRPEGGMDFARHDLANTAEVKSASRNLHRAYNMLMQAFPHEPRRNKSAFYDYLCALDYL